MKRGIITIVWGDRGKLPLDRLLASTRRHHPELPHEIIEVVPERTGYGALQEKARMLDLSPFEETLFLDADTVVLGNLDFGFQKAVQHGLAISICENPWARRYPRLFQGDEVEYNTGVVFFSRKAEPLFDAWKRCAKTRDSLLIHLMKGKAASQDSNDQGTFCAAIEETGFNPFVLPLNWNFRPVFQRSFFGPIKIWHDYSDPPADIAETLPGYYRSPRSVIQFHKV
jgi:hypothetical protein